MVITSSRTPSQPDLLAATPGTAVTTFGSAKLKPQRASLKRRGLSKFYANKSQSFNCMADLNLASAFFGSQSTLVLAKPLALSPSWQQPFSSVMEEQWEAPCSQQQQQQTHELPCSHSAPGSPLHHREAEGGLMDAFGTSNHSIFHHHASTPFDGGSNSRSFLQAGSLSLSSSGSARTSTSMDSSSYGAGGTSSLDADDGGFDSGGGVDGAGGGAVCSDLCLQEPTDELCGALQATSLATDPHHNPQHCAQLLSMPMWQHLG